MITLNEDLFSFYVHDRNYSFLSRSMPSIDFSFFTCDWKTLNEDLFSFYVYDRNYSFLSRSMPSINFSFFTCDRKTLNEDLFSFSKPYFLSSSVRRNHPSTCYRWALILCPQRRCTMKPSSQILRTDPWTNKIPLKEHIPRLHPNRSQKPLNTRCEESVFISRTGECIVINAENEW